MTEGQDDSPSESKFGNFLDSVDSFSKKIESSIIGWNTNSEVIEDPIETVENPIEDKLKLEDQVKYAIQYGMGLSFLLHLYNLFVHTLTTITFTGIIDFSL